MSIQIKQKTIFFALFVFLIFTRIYLCDPTLGLDEAEQMVFAQNLAFGYPSQPPLYTWLQYLVFQCFGFTLFSLAFLKYGLLIGSIGVYYQLCRLICRPALVWPAFLSWALIPNISYDLLMHRTHVVLALLATCLTVHWLLSTANDVSAVVPSKKLAKTRKIFSYFYLGLIVAMGCLSKFNFLVFLTLFGIIAWSIPSYRQRLKNRWILLSCAIVLLIITPYCLWILNNPAIAFYAAYKLAPAEKSVSNGIFALMLSMSCFMLPSSVFFGFFYNQYFLHKRKNLRPLFSLTQSKQDKAVQSKEPFETALQQPSQAYVLLLRYHVLLIPALLLMVIGGGLHEVKTHWLLPLFCFTPLLLFGHLSQCITDKTGFWTKQRILWRRSYLYTCLLFQLCLLMLWITRTPYLAKWPLDAFVNELQKTSQPSLKIASNSHWLLGSLIYRFSEAPESAKPTRSPKSFKGELLFPTVPFELPKDPTLWVWEGKEMPDFLKAKVGALHVKERMIATNEWRVLAGAII